MTLRRRAAAAVLLCVLLPSEARPQRTEVSSRTERLGQSWDQAYLEATPSFNAKPNAFLVEVAASLTPGTALDVGMGQGRNALFLASQGWEVTGFDVSEVGLQSARAQARAAGLTMTTVRASDTEFDWGTSRWEMIVMTYFPSLREAMPRVIQSLRPGGVLVVEAYHADSGAAGPSVTFQAGELPALVTPLRVVRYEEPHARADWGLFDTALVRLLAQKPRQ